VTIESVELDTASDAVDAAHWRFPQGATGLLRTFAEAGVIEAADVHVARRLTTLAKDGDESVALAIALVVRAVRGGSVCLDLPDVEGQVGLDTLPWPEASGWLAAVKASPLMGTATVPPVLHLYEERLLYFDRYWREEQQVCADLLALASQTAVPDVAATLDRLFPPPDFVEQRAAAEIALAQSVTVLTGGPGTGKTTTVARLLALFAEQAPGGRLRIALAAPTGKAAARLHEAVSAEVARLDEADRTRLEELHAVTLHSLLGSRPDNSNRFRRNRSNRLPHDVIVVDETSMVSLTMMARLLEAVRPETKLLLVGDPDQLASVEAGAVLADLVDGLSGRADVRIAALTTKHRFGAHIGALAEAIRVGDADRAIDLLRAGEAEIDFIESDEPARLRNVLVPHALSVREAAVLGDGVEALRRLDEHRFLCAHRAGEHGVAHWNRQVERWLADETAQSLWTQWYVGRPLLVTANDYGLKIFNGETGVVVAGPDGERVFIASASGPQDFSPSRLGDVETMHAMTIHKSQGSQANEVTVLMPPVQSRLLTRELFYTAVTRAKRKVRVVGSADEVRAAIDRRAVRATGLALRLRG